ncbi:unnamed protein product [Dicrocoelium dendriticum]|nr:unnamed protein product [Dicrocoelium dendriticum]
MHVQTVLVQIYAGMETAVTPVELGCRGSVVNSSINPYSPKSRVSTTLANRMRSKPAKDDVDTLLPGFIQPGQLACADIVLTSYSVVQRELNWAEVAVERHSGLGDRPQLRLTQRYLCRPSPLTCVRWWRVCLDEAQLVERITSKAARMMSHIESVHRWCVTGTPAERSINDLFGLFAFLRFEPFSVQSYWHSQLYQPFLAATAPSWLISVEPRACPAPPPSPTYSRVQSTLLADMLSLILWRNTKILLGDQLSLPPITEETHWVTFTSVERYIHDRVLSESATALQSLLNSTSVTPDQTLATLPTSIHCRLVYLVTRLRQACTHASLVVATGTTGRRSRSHNPAQSTGHRLGHGDLLLDSEDADDDGDTSYSRFSDLRRGSRLDGPSASAARAIRHTGTGCSTMTEVIRRVVDDTRRECEGLLRSWVFAKNGAAGCFIIKHQYDLAAECYRDVLRTADNLEKRHGVLADWSQRLHALANLHWLIQSCGVPLLNDPLPNDPHVSTQGGQLTITDPDSSDSVTLDPRVDRDLVPKAERLRSLYIQLHSRLLSRVHENLEPVVSELDSEFTNTEDELADIHTTFVPYGASWLTWLSDAVQYLIDCGLGSNLIEMTVSSFRGKPGVNRSSFRTILLEVRSVEAFKATLLTETLEILKARHRLRTAMKPLVDTWHSFKAGKAVNQSVLQSFYACCARSQEDSKEDFRTQSEFQASGKQKVANKGRELKNLDALSDSKQKPRKKSHCAYCIAMRALIDYQCALNHERPKAGYSTAKEQIEKLDAADQIDGSGSGMMRSNPLIVSISIVCQQIIKRRPHDTLQGDWHRQARRLEQLFRQMSKEFLLTSSTLTLTKEWWNFHYDMEQFVIRLQANCPSELAFIESHEVESQLHTYVVDSQLVWPRLQSRLGHFGFLRNAYLAAVTGADQSTKNPDAKLTTTFRLECPTCLQTHNPKNPTFALLPGCWHTLCLPCHDRIASSGHLSQRRCPLCRTPFHSNETSGFNARRRRPLTLIHYDGSQNKVVPESSKPFNELEPPVVGDHSSKIQAVIRCLRKIKEFDPDAKAIVFSSWLSVLITTANALEQNGLAYVTLFQPRHACCPGRLAGFHCPGSATWILLMPIQLGANGLNLTSANHLLLIDPVLSHGREAQAIARMHRIGQTRAGVVHRFLVRDSIEATLHSSHMRAQAEAMRADPSLTSMATTGCMIGAGPRRSTHGSSGLPGPGEDRAFLMQMTIGQLSGLLQSRVTCDLSAEDWDWATPSFSFNSDSKPSQSM